MAPSSVMDPPVLSMSMQPGLSCSHHEVVQFGGSPVLNLQTSSLNHCSKAEGTSTKCYCKSYMPSRKEDRFRSTCSPKSNVIVYASKTEGLRVDSSEDTSLKKFTWPDGQKPRVCILGGGFGGLYTALRLESLVWPADAKPQVLIVDQSERFVFKPMMYELLSKEVELWEVAPLFKDLLAGTSIMFQKDTVKSLTPLDSLRGSNKKASKPEGAGGEVFLKSGLVIEYDWLVLSLGAESRRDIVPGAIEHALPFSSWTDALEVDQQLKHLERQKFGLKNSSIRVVVVGAGYSGVELAATLAERLGEQGKVQVVDVASEICPSAPAGNRETAYKVLASRNVQLILGFLASSIRKEALQDDPSGGPQIGPYILDLRPANKSHKRSGPSDITLHADLILWTIGTKPALPSELLNMDIQPLPLNGRGRVETCETLRVKGHSRVFAIGDSACLRDSSGMLLPSTAQVALQEADYVGWNLWAGINNRPLLPFRFQNLGEMMTLGKNDAAVSLSFIDGLTLDGPIAHTARKLAYLYRLPTNEHRLKVGISWFAKSAVDTVAKLQDTIASMVGSS